MARLKINEKQWHASYANKDVESRIHTVHDTPGKDSDQSPYRSELSSSSMVFAVIQYLITYNDNTLGTILLGLDDKKAMEQTNKSLSLCPEQQSFDFLVDIREKMMSYNQVNILLCRSSSVTTT